MADDIILRSPSNAAELKEFYEPLSIAFSEELTDAERAAERPLMELDRLINAFDGDRRIGSSGAFSMRLTVPGGAEVPASGITAVGVVPDARRRGVLRQMMTYLLDDAVRRKEPLAILWASEATIYQRFGFGMSTLTSWFEADRTRIAFREPLPPRDDVRIRMVDTDEGVSIGISIYDEVRRRIPGSMFRPEAMWKNILMADAEWMRAGSGPKYRAVLEVDGEPRAFVVYRVKGDWSPRGSANTVFVIELVGLDPESEQRLWQWICSMDLATTISARRGPVPHPLQQWLLEPRRLGMIVGDGLWLRMVDLPAALSARRYSGEGRVVLEVADALLPANAGRWAIDVAADGSAEVSSTTDEPDLSLDVAVLGAAYLGAWRFADLAAAGRVQASRPEAPAEADALFAVAQAPFANTMF